jgi:hypothetical protein
MLKSFLKRALRWAGAAFHDQPFRQIEVHREIARVHAAVAASMPDNLMLKGGKVYAQSDEDGIIDAIFQRIAGKTFIEIGCGNGLENNTHALVLKGWRGVWGDGSSENITAIRRQIGDSKVLLVEKQFVDKQNIAALVQGWCQFLGTTEPDFFSLDIDGNDLHVLREALGACSPKVLCCEYNAKFIPPLDVAIRYNAHHRWLADDYQGASLCAFVEALPDHALVACNVSGSNAFFVRKDLADRFTIYPVERLYQPARYHLSALQSGHSPSLKFLRDYLDKSTKQ